MSFGVDKERLLALNSSRPDVKKLNELGGLAGLASKLKSDLRKGLTSAQVSDERKKVYVNCVISD
jgi:hypothetical protein